MIKVVVAVIEDNRGRLLIAKRSYPKKFKNKWEFPGGKVKEKEDPKTALVREIKEELEVEVKINEKLFSFKYSNEEGDICFKTYLCNLKSKKIEMVPREHKELRWVSIDELRNYDLIEADEVIVDEVAQT